VRLTQIKLSGFKSFVDPTSIHVPGQLVGIVGPNGCGKSNVIDAVRCAKLGLDYGLKGALIAPSSYFKKSPPYQFPDDYCRAVTEAFIKDPRGTEQKMRAVVAGRATATRAAKKGSAKAAAPGRDGRKHAMARAASSSPVAQSANGNGRVGAKVAARAAVKTRRARKVSRKRATARAR